MSDLRQSGPGGPPSKSFRLDRQSGKLMGVCAGIANYFGIDVMLVRLGFVLATLVGFGSPILIYLAIGLIAD
ncbi:PspC domain-containing protein [Qipengyuania sp. DY56-A-20]|jgi:phage shock protein PspC (stress-responsive transcriptional regulator)|uniref:PspC domain-containing protein n=1 Tax=Qipengyuania benthica TaxID=3067651 RepID=A0ABT9H985_9SPHN|nr:PspC domain-containing protein [Qipengyuania sp. DY56-A-20]MBU1255183.1 PspC domain-containing protein [Alphaproteobacteria bacterium]MBU1607040.1 PspC domain-containing protein [Alphaproteobacteria bacterium]MDP4539887.1 PspC domain-containing protein [Qipengyuania sp. DY56-A-20]